MALTCSLCKKIVIPGEEHYCIPKDFPEHHSIPAEADLLKAFHSRPTETIEKNDSTHGGYVNNGILFNSFTTKLFPYMHKLSPTQELALTMIFLKISRILSGNPDFLDHWHDIAGYALLEEEKLKKKMEYPL